MGIRPMKMYRIVFNDCLVVALTNTMFLDGKYSVALNSSNKFVTFYNTYYTVMEFKI